MDFANHIIKFTENFGFWGYLIAFLLAFLESLAIVGGLIPGTTAIVMLGFMCYRGYLNIYVLMAVTVLGAVLGDSVSYWLGTKGTHLFKEENRFLKARHLDMGQKFFDKHGNKSIFLGRFIGIIRPMIPFAAGLSRMNYRVFLFWNVFSGIVWGVSHIYIGYFFGGAFKIIESWSTRVSVLFIILVVIVILFWLLARASTPLSMFFFRILSNLIDVILGTYPARKFIISFPTTSDFIGRRFARNVFSGLPLTLLILTVISFIVLFVILADGILDADPVTDLDQRVALFLVFFRDAFLVKSFIWISLLGNINVVHAVSLSFIASMLLWNRKRMIWPFLGMIAVCEAVAWFIREGFTRPRPTGVIPAYIEKAHSFPSEHSSLAVLLYGFICYFLVRILLRERPRLCIWTIFMTLLLVAMIGLSRLYLGAHYISDVIGGYLIGGICLITGISLFEWVLQGGKGSPEKDIPMDTGRRILTFLFVMLPVLFFIFYGVFIYRPAMITGKALETSLVLTAKISPHEIFTFNKWTKYTIGLSGRKREPLSFMIWTKDDQYLENTFIRAGWKKPDQPSIKNILKMGFATAEGKSYDSAPVTPVFWLNQANEFAFEKNTPDSFPKMHCVRIWKTNLVDTNGNILYLGASGKTSAKGSLDISRERNAIVGDLNGTGLVSYVSSETLSDPLVSSKRAFAIHYFSDGMIAVVILN
ncbi:MAG: LssY C-terminal domain-containing protein [Victivallales bacterium]